MISRQRACRVIAVADRNQSPEPPRTTGAGGPRRFPSPTSSARVRHRGEDVEVRPSASTPAAAGVRRSRTSLPSRARGYQLVLSDTLGRPADRIGARRPVSGSDGHGVPCVWRAYGAQGVVASGNGLFAPDGASPTEFSRPGHPKTLRRHAISAGNLLFARPVRVWITIVIMRVSCRVVPVCRLLPAIITCSTRVYPVQLQYIYMHINTERCILVAFQCPFFPYT